MQQTLLALAAIIAFSSYALTRHHTDNDTERRAVGIATEQAATDVARSRMALLDVYAFDEDDIDRKGIRQSPPSGHLGPDAGESTPASYDDVDDWDGHEETLPYATTQGELQLHLSIDVRYVRPTDPNTPSSTPTLAKEVLVHVTEVSPPADRAAVQVVLRRVVTPAGASASSSTSTSSR